MCWKQKCWWIWTQTQPLFVSLHGMRYLGFRGTSTFRILPPVKSTVFLLASGISRQSVNIPEFAPAVRQTHEALAVLHAVAHRTHRPVQNEAKHAPAMAAMRGICAKKSRNPLQDWI